MKSVTFDRAADIYDQTRGFPPGIADLVADAAAEVIEPGARVLEIGIGTGRIAKPLLARGLAVTGVDLSRKMMSRLLDTLPAGSRPPSLVEADAARLPLLSGAFRAVLSVHVFHLIADWREALAEVKRSLGPRGIFLSGYEWRPDDYPGALILDKWRGIVRARGLDGYQPGARDFADVKAALFEAGAIMDERVIGEWTTMRTLSEHIETIEHRTWSSTWNVPDNFFGQCLAELRGWALGKWGSLELEFTTPHKFIWQRFRWE